MATISQKKNLSKMSTRYIMCLQFGIILSLGFVKNTPLHSVDFHLIFTKNIAGFGLVLQDHMTMLFICKSTPNITHFMWRALFTQTHQNIVKAF